MHKIAFYDDNLIHLLMDDRFPVGGATVQANAWISGFIDNGWDVTLITTKKKSYNKFIDSKKINIVYSYDQEKGIRIFRWVYYRIPMIFYSIWKSKVDYVYHGVPSNMSGILGTICKLLNKSLILRMSNDFLTDERIKNKFGQFWRFLYFLGLRFSSLIICQNNYQFSNLSKMLTNTPITIISNPILNYDISPYLTREEYISWVGIFQYQKNLPLLLELAKEFQKLQFKIAGKPYSAIDKNTENSLHELKKLANVEFVGYLTQKEIRQFIGKSRLLLITSFYEGFSNIILEALSVATPVLLRENIDPDGIIKNNGFGYVAKTDKNFNEFLLLALNNNFNMKPHSINYINKIHSPQKKIRELLEFMKDNNL